MKPPLILPLLCLCLPALSAQTPVDPLKLELLTAKATCDQVEPVLARLWLVNQGPKPVRVARCAVESRLLSAKPVQWSQGMRSRASVWLTRPDGSPLDEQSYCPRQSRYLLDKDYGESGSGRIGLGGGRGGPRLVRFWQVPAAGRVLLAERQIRLPSRRFTTPGGKPRWCRAILAPGRYRLNAVLRTDRIAPDGTAIVLRAAAPLVILRSRPGLRRSWQVLGRIALREERAALERRLGRPRSERFILRRSKGLGEVGLFELRWRLGPLASAPSPCIWGRVLPPVAVCRFNQAGRLVELEVVLEATRDL